MSLSRRILLLAVVCLANFSAAQVQDQVAAERVLGPHWRQIARTSGMIFSGTVLKIKSQPSGKGRPLPLILTIFHVDRPIAGVRAGQRLTIREWEGAWSTQRAMLRGQRLLIFLYPPSRLGLTSPVGGRLGQVALDERGEVVSSRLENFVVGSQRNSAAEAGDGSRAFAPRQKSCPPEERSDAQPVMWTDMRSKAGVAGRALDRCDASGSTRTVEGFAATRPITMAQLERAIRRARLTPTVTRRDHVRTTPGN